MQISQADRSEIAILSRVLEPEMATFSKRAARAILALDFNQDDKSRMRELSSKAREGTLTPEERTEIDNYERVGHLLNLLQSKVRSLDKGRRGTNGQAKST
jgi:hypothetical protein